MYSRKLSTHRKIDHHHDLEVELGNSLGPFINGQIIYQRKNRMNDSMTPTLCKWSSLLSVLCCLLHCDCRKNLSWKLCFSHKYVESIYRQYQNNTLVVNLLAAPAASLAVSPATHVDTPASSAAATAHLLLPPLHLCLVLGYSYSWYGWYPW